MNSQALQVDENGLIVGPVTGYVRMVGPHVRDVLDRTLIKDCD